ncbi:MAG: hypothetical protein K2W82_02010 [Candidatus Obscuribacterales bacterium]|nr:hypothetical protein [Candidatus Obscuribacterales bacterium]
MKQPLAISKVYLALTCVLALALPLCAEEEHSSGVLELGGSTSFGNETTPALLPQESSPAVAEELHQASMKLSGSMCFSCVQNLQDKISALPGVKKLTINKPLRSPRPVYVADALSYAEALVVYDRTKINLDDLKEAFIKRGYVMYRVSDKFLN